MIDKPEVQNNQDNVSIASAHVFEGAYGLTRTDSSTRDTSTMVARNDRTSTGGQVNSDAWPPPLEVSDSRGNILTNGSGDSKTSVTAQASAEQPAVNGAQTGDLKRPDNTAVAKPGDPAEKPAYLANLPRELARESTLMQNVTGPQKQLLDAAFQNVGQPLWSQSRHADLTANGAYGCAAAESVVKQQAGYDYADSPLVSGLMNQLMKNGWTKHPFEDRQPGDTVIRHKAGKSWMKGGGKAHIGTVGADTNYAYNNDSATGSWKYEPIDSAFNPRQNRFVLRAPGSETLVAKGR